MGGFCTQGTGGRETQKRGRISRLDSSSCVGVSWVVVLLLTAEGTQVAVMHGHVLLQGNLLSAAACALCVGESCKVGERLLFCVCVRQQPSKALQ